MVVLLLPLSLALDDGDFDCGGGGGSGGVPVAAAVAAVAAVDDRDRWRWHLMAAAAFNGGYATTSWRSKRAHNKRIRGWHKGRQHNNQLIFCRTTTLICGVVIYATHIFNFWKPYFRFY